MNTESRVGLVLGGCILAVVLCAAAPAQSDHVVTFADDFPAREVERWVREQGCSVRYRFHTSNSLWIKYPATRNIRREDLLADKDVVHVTAGVLGVPDLVPNDPLYPGQWHCLNQTPRPGGVCSLDADIQGERAWDIVTAAPGSVIAILDDGILLSHPDLAANLTPGWDVADNDPDPSPDIGNLYSTHGTQVAGIIGAVGNNGIGAAGICWDVRIMPIKMHPDGAEYSYFDYHAAAAVDYAVARGVDIINCSWHFEFPADPPATSAFYRAFAAASDAGIVVVAAAGNTRADLDAADVHRYPAKFNFANMVTVTLTDAADGNIRAFGFGVGTVDIAAPGDGLPTTLVDAFGNPTYSSATGTSVSTPLVAGAIALIREVHPELVFPGEILQLMYDRAEALPSLDGQVADSRRLNLYRCVTAFDATPPGPVDLVLVGTTSATATLQWTEPGDDGNAGFLDHFAMVTSGLAIPVQPSYKVYDLPPTLGPGTVHTYTIAGLSPGGLNVQIAAVDDQHNRALAGLSVPAVDVELAPTSLFRLATTGEVVEGTAVLHNVGTREGLLVPYRLSGGDWLEFAPDPFVVAPGDSHVFTFRCRASGLCLGSYPARIAFDGGCPVPLDVLLAVVADAPELGVAPRAVDLGTVVPEAVVATTVTVANRGCRDLDWTAELAAAGPWSVKPRSGTLPAGGSVELLVSITASRVPPISLVLGSNAPFAGSRAVPITWSFDSVPEDSPAATATDDGPTAFPNPFNPETTIRCFLDGAGSTELQIFDVRGARVRTINLGDRGGGVAAVVWNGCDDAGGDVPSGIYFCRFVQAGQRVGATLKLSLVK